MTVVGRLMTATLVVAGSIALGGGTALAQGQAFVQGQGFAQAQGNALDGQITSPSDGQVVSGGSVPISARTRLAQLSMALYVEGPSTPRQKVASGGANQTLSGTFDAGDAPNGSFTVTLRGEISGSTYETSTFKLRRAAAAPSGVDATLRGADKVVVTWSKGREPDLQSYEVATTQSGIVGRMSADEACGGGTCKATLAVPPKAAGQRVGFTVKAYRGDGDGGSIGSGNSGAAYVNVPAPPAAKPTTKKATTAPTTKPQTNKNGVDELPTIPNNKKKTEPKTTNPTGKVTAPKNDTKLPAMPETDKNGNLPLPTADEQSKDDGLAPAADESQAPADSKVTAQSSESPLGSVGQYGLYVAAGLVLLLVAVHFGAWARRRSLASAGGPGGGSGVGVGGGGGGGYDGPPSGDSVPSATTAPRRPAVVLAVAKTRPKRDQPGDPASSRVTGSPQVSGLTRASGAPSGSASASGPLPDGQVPVSGSVGAVEAGRGAVEPPAALPLYLSADDIRTAQNQADAARHEPVRIALPSSAVTVMPESSVPAPAVRLEDRWDDYLPPTPRAMEDSGFWERPQPGDFWTPDERVES
ncbi:hypothetical protein [Nonomuraea endophytica]|uniref:Fibronectin type-III domain-containing protein n=1 Tax=Nonomuraea endophytica TaxID=714136 RepID=A0A7W8ECM6_9ACTN|nr:hypothetical protein [Nonomuraea endophytica]MBB5075610.1 hypothetical protein [Nonomuraea endophytica]